MALVRFNITDFRNLLSIHLEPLSGGFNYIFGNNGSGKTSLLEAIYYLSMGRSFRSSLTSRIISHAADKFSLFGQLLGDADQTISLGLERTEKGEIKMRIEGEKVSSIAEMANLVPVQLINTNSYTLLETPHCRRKYLDWGAFYSSNQFLRIWKQYCRALKQRNAALRSHISSQELKIWTKEVAETGFFLDEMRKQYVNRLIPLLSMIVNELLTINHMSFEYQPGWDDKTSYEDHLIKTLDKDRQIGHTQFGPHRADFKILINNIPAKDILSRGQQKLFVCAMIVAQGTLLYSSRNKKPIYLVDDLPSELDLTSRSKLLSLLSKQDTQIFVTAIERQILEGLLMNHPMKMFHVEHGKVGELN